MGQPSSKDVGKRAIYNYHVNETNRELKKFQWKLWKIGIHKATIRRKFLF